MEWYWYVLIAFIVLGFIGDSGSFNNSGSSKKDVCKTCEGKGYLYCYTKLFGGNTEKCWDCKGSGYS